MCKEMHRPRVASKHLYVAAVCLQVSAAVSCRQAQTHRTSPALCEFMVILAYWRRCKLTLTSWKTNKSKQTTSNHHSYPQTDTAPTELPINAAAKGVGRQRTLLPTACLTAEWMGCTSLTAMWVIRSNYQKNPQTTGWEGRWIFFPTKWPLLALMPENLVWFVQPYLSTTGWQENSKCVVNMLSKNKNLVTVAVSSPYFQKFPVSAARHNLHTVL